VVIGAVFFCSTVDFPSGGEIFVVSGAGEDSLLALSGTWTGWTLVVTGAGIAFAARGSFSILGLAGTGNGAVDFKGTTSSLITDFSSTREDKIASDKEVNIKRAATTEVVLLKKVAAPLPPKVEEEDPPNTAPISPPLPD
jgi:hypothetical protein